MRSAILICAAALVVSCKAAPPSRDIAIAGWRAGDQREYDLALSVDARIAGTPLTQFALRGRWIVTAVDVSAERALLLAELRHGALHTEHAALQPEYSALERELAAPFFFAMQPDGTLGDAYVDMRTPAIIVGIWRTLGASLQFASDPADEWTAEEVDATGRYIARYRRGSSPGSYDKQKLRYVEVATLPASRGRLSQFPITSEIVDASATLLVDKHHRLERLTTHERVRTTAEATSIEWESKLALSRVAQHVVSPPASWKEQVASRRRYAPDHAFADTAGRQQRDAELAGDRELADVLAEIDAAKTTDDGAKTNTFTAVRAILRVRPAAIAEARALIDSDSRHAALLIDALGAAGTADAQDALRSLLVRSRLSDRHGKRLAIALSRSPDPQPQSMQALVRLLDDPALGAQATYGIGTMARRFAAADKTDEANTAIAILRDRAQTAPSALKLIIALRGIANSGATVLYPVAERYFDHEDDGVRAAAVEALQLMAGARVDLAIADRIAHASDSSVRLAAARAARLRDPTRKLQQAVETRVRVEPDHHVRLGLVRVLAAWAPRHPQLHPTLAWVAEHDAQDVLRREAHQAQPLTH
jgi:hypothetical protein